MCKFCDRYNWVRQHAKTVKKESGVNTYLSVRLYERLVKDRETISTATHMPMQLVHCPTCGKRLNGRKEASNENHI